MDTVVGLLVDNSGSMEEDGKLNLALVAATAFCQTLERVGIKHEVLGFTTRSDLVTHYYSKPGTKPVITREVFERIQEDAKKLGREFSHTDAVQMVVYKTFDETYRKTRLRFASMREEMGDSKPIRCWANIDGESVELAAQRLLMRREQRKVLLVFSDGYPAATGNSAHLQGHLKTTVKACEARGIETLGVGIMSDSVLGYYPKSVVVRNASHLPTVVMKELTRMLI